MKNTELRNKKQLNESDIVDNCDCLIGSFSGDNIRKSEIKDNLEMAYKTQKLFKENGLLQNREPAHPLQIIDARKGYVFRFVFCPYCGVKIDWKAIVNNLR